MQDKFILIRVKVILKKVVETKTTFIKHFSCIFFFQKNKSIKAPNAYFLLKAIETNFNIDTTQFFNCEQMLNYKLNFLSRIEYKC